MKKLEPQSTQSRHPAGSTVQPFHRVTLLTFTLLAATLLPTLAFGLEPSALPPAVSQPSTINPQPTIDPGVFQPLVDGLTGKYGWLTTVLLAIGSLRILFKPVMLVVENIVKNDPAKFAAVQKFVAGPIYKTIAAVLDVGASIKLPLIKPPGPPTS